MAGAVAKKRRVVARVTLAVGDVKNPQDVPPGQAVDIEAEEAAALVRRGFAIWAKPDTPGLPLEGGASGESDADA
ncbi:hypothetical protein ACIU1J_01925 [Azospirillum doebereinerae]|uniref:hypothetical protein n=1 Tax=Azospirillum doebereinerae TaxID=92933 RepID=UPI001EE60D65|nr:hypothetical protein [Azospirillum doebereinerae]MCG5240090.1 hypothetical protein [Azospirillum doebereinerae]